VVTFREETTIASAFERIRETNRRVVDVLVCSEDDRLVGIVPLQELVGAPLETALGSVANREFVAIHAMGSRDEVVELLTRHRLASLPVLDLDGRVLGTIRDDGLVLAAQQAAAEDLQRMVGAGKEERALSSPWLTIKSRLPWLLINLGTAFAAAFVVALFDETIARFTALAVLLPIVAGQSGNTGAQALAVTSRGLALREIRIRHWWRVLSKEVIASLGNGIAIAVATALAVVLFSGNTGIALVIGVSMIISMLMAAIAGAMIPVLLTALGRDPATASSIILTTVTDIAGFFSFLR
jgi:magnesium transporter